jgi:putative iron-regulated protein
MATTLVALLTACATSQKEQAPPQVKAQDVVTTYANVAFRSYAAAYKDALAMQEAIHVFLDDPTEANLAAARHAWLNARESYGQTEAFRFYEGPIDAMSANGEELGPEGRLNAWPLNEAYIDYVQGNPEAGLIHIKHAPINAAVLAHRNALEDEADVATGYHAIEFLLWGQDLSTEGHGARPASDFAKYDLIRQRRRNYLTVATQMLVDDLRTIVTAWSPGRETNYRQWFLDQPTDESLSRMMTGIATLSGFELASERIAVSLDSGDQEDEHSCFSDNTHRDIVTNAQGVANVYFGTYGQYHGKSLSDLVAQADPTLNAQLADNIRSSVKLAEEITPPVDRILASPAGHPGRAQLEALVISLQDQATLLQKAGEALSVEVTVAAE